MPLWDRSILIEVVALFPVIQFALLTLGTSKQRREHDAICKVMQVKWLSRWSAQNGTYLRITVGVAQLTKDASQWFNDWDWLYAAFRLGRCGVRMPNRLADTQPPYG
jgi:hypothetical protein